jgi:hypothetical protein
MTLSKQNQTLQTVKTPEAKPVFQGSDVRLHKDNANLIPIGLSAFGGGNVREVRYCLHT